jgi:iron-sulfur cluster repair protein YtfE (RIC family)
MTLTRRQEPGLHLRMKNESRRIAEQHHRLAELRGRVTEEIQARSVAGARSAFTDFSGALEAHFGVEEKIYFPAVRGLDDQLRTAVDGLLAEHRKLRIRVRDLTQRFESGNGFACLVVLQALIDELEEHEQREEAVMVQAGRTPK